MAHDRSGPDGLRMPAISDSSKRVYRCLRGMPTVQNIAVFPILADPDKNNLQSGQFLIGREVVFGRMDGCRATVQHSCSCPDRSKLGRLQYIPHRSPEMVSSAPLRGSVSTASPLSPVVSPSRHLAPPSGLSHGPGTMHTHIAGCTSDSQRVVISARNNDRLSSLLRMPLSHPR